MKFFLVLALTFASISGFGSQILLLTNKSGEKVGQINCDGARADDAIEMVSELMKNKTVKNVVSTRYTIDINLDENKNSDGSSRKSVTFRRSVMDQSGIKCQLTVEL